jgi:hypothetical protein
MREILWVAAGTGFVFLMTCLAKVFLIGCLSGAVEPVLGIFMVLVAACSGIRPSIFSKRHPGRIFPIFQGGHKTERRP